MSAVTEPPTVSEARAGESSDVHQQQQQQQLQDQVEPVTSEQTPSCNTARVSGDDAGTTPHSASQPTGATAHQSAFSLSDPDGSFMHSAVLMPFYMRLSCNAVCLNRGYC